ncbi:MAG: abortive infection family protein [Lachnospiraceae bacterium]|nr:abortive infection family protein [Lachnospiraceae bacterium]
MAGIISKEDGGLLLKLFIRGGDVLDFSKNDFDVFTTNSIGIGLCSYYGLSKVKSLLTYLNDASDEKRTKLLTDLFSYYEEHMESEYNEDYHEDSIWITPSKYNEYYANLFSRCKSIVEKVNNSSAVTENLAEELKKSFSSDYISKQIDLMLLMQTTNPTEAIGKAKELIESCCKTILEEMGIPWDKNDKISKLTGKVLKELNLMPDDVQPGDPGADSIKAILGNLREIPTRLSDLRNPYGSGHGKSASFVGLEERHAKLAVGCCVTFVDFVWNTYESRKRDKNVSSHYGAKVRYVPNEAGGNTAFIE